MKATPGTTEIMCSKLFRRSQEVFLGWKQEQLIPDWLFMELEEQAMEAAAAAME